MRARLALTAAALLAPFAAADETLVVLADGSPVQGAIYSRTFTGAAYNRTVRGFFGVPYAAPPVGALRWADPAPATPWTAPFDATHDPPGCPQLCWNDEPPHICPNVQSEDCLYLNVWAPRAAALTGPAPVIIFFHGGNFNNGAAGGLESGGPLLYEGTEFANTTGTIVVVAQYRLGVFGQLYLGGGSAVDGNYMLKDQVAVMKWVQANAAAFGGDAARVTLMGQSAGAMAISAHMTRPETAGLYAGAILHSQPFGEPWRDVNSSLAIAQAFAGNASCPWGDPAATEACVRALDWQAALTAQVNVELDFLADLEHILQVVVVWSPTTGTPYLPQRPLEAWVAGNVIDVPVIVGTTANESVIFVWEVLNTSLPQVEFDALAVVLFGIGPALELPFVYPVPSPAPDDFRIYAADAITDGLFICPSRNATEGLLASPSGASHKGKVWMYTFNDHTRMSGAIWGANFTECGTNDAGGQGLGPAVCHGSDLPLIWHPDSEAAIKAQWGPGDNALSTKMQAYWAAFAAHGDPNAGGGGLPAWPAYDAAARQMMAFNATDAVDTSAVTTSWRASWCAWWDNVVGYNVW